MKKLILMLLLLFSGVSYCQVEKLYIDFYGFIKDKAGISGDYYGIITYADKKVNSYFYGEFLDDSYNSVRYGFNNNDTYKTESLIEAFKKLPEIMNIIFVVKKTKERMSVFDIKNKNIREMIAIAISRSLNFEILYIE